MGAKHDRQLVDEIAREILRGQNITLELDSARRASICVDNAVMMPDTSPRLAASARILREIVWEMVVDKVKRMRPETLGRIASVGEVGGLSQSATRTSLFVVHGREYLHSIMGGKDLLMTIAATAIVARMWDFLQQQLQNWLAGQAEAEKRALRG